MVGKIGGLPGSWGCSILGGQACHERLRTRLSGTSMICQKQDGMDLARLIAWHPGFQALCYELFVHLLFQASQPAYRHIANITARAPLHRQVDARHFLRYAVVSG
jgi:hypothetical protein